MILPLLSSVNFKTHPNMCADDVYAKESWLKKQDVYLNKVDNLCNRQMFVDDEAAKKEWLKKQNNGHVPIPVADKKTMWVCFEIEEIVD